MKTLIVSIVCFLCLAISVAVFAQNNSAVLCKDQPIPDGFVISGETISASCKGTSAWVIQSPDATHTRLPTTPALLRFSGR